jgi:hypothetical protein
MSRNRKDIDKVIGGSNADHASHANGAGAKGAGGSGASVPGASSKPTPKDSGPTPYMRTGRSNNPDKPGKRSAVPLIVRKILGILEETRISTETIQREAGLGANKIWSWSHQSGEPDIQQAIRISGVLDADLEYLLNDDLDLKSPFPRRSESPARRLAEQIEEHGLTPKEVESYLRAVANAHDLGINAPDLNRIVIAASKERDKVGVGR